MLRVWGRRSSSNVQKVMWFVGELGIPHEHIPAGGPYGLVRDEKFKAMNPNGLVPVIQDDDMVLWESNAIVRYLAARYGRPQFWPDDPGERALADQWMDWAATTFQPSIVGLFWSYWRTPEKDRNLEAIRGFEGRTARELRLIDAVLGRHRYLVANGFTLADIPSGVHLYRYYTMGISIPKLPHVESWYARLQERPAYREHVMVSYEELRGRLTF